MMNNWGKGLPSVFSSYDVVMGTTRCFQMNNFFFCSPAHRYTTLKRPRASIWVGGPFVSKLSQTPPRKVGISNEETAVYWFISVHMLSRSSVAHVYAIGLLACVKYSENNPNGAFFIEPIFDMRKMSCEIERLEFSERLWAVGTFFLLRWHDNTAG